MTNANIVSTTVNSFVKHIKTAGVICLAGATALTIVEVGKNLIKK